MSSFFTSNSLIADVKRRSHVPESQVTFQTEDFLAFANDEMRIGMVPSMLQFHEEYFVYEVRVPLVVGQTEYPVPPRALGGRIRSIFFMDNIGNYKEMARINPDDIVYYQRRSMINYPHVFYMRNNSIVPVPEVSTSSNGVFIFHIFMRPNEIVTEDRVGIITNVNALTGEVTFSKLPSILTVGSLCDMIEVEGGHRLKGIEKEVLAIDTSTKTLTFAVADIPADLKVGDHVALMGETIIPMIPDELHSILAQRVVCRCLEAQGDQAGLAAANTKLQEMEVRMGNLIDNRIEGAPQKVMNLRGPLRSAKIRRRRNMW